MNEVLQERQSMPTREHKQAYLKILCFACFQCHVDFCLKFISAQTKHLTVLIGIFLTTVALNLQ